MDSNALTDNTALLWSLAIGAVVIIIALACYAVYMVRRVNKQQLLINKHNKRVQDKRNATIAEHVETLCKAGVGQQCDLSEIVIRVYNLMDHVQGCKRMDFATTFPASFELYQTVKDMAIGESRQALEKQERMKQNLARQKAEAKLSEQIMAELQQLQQAVLPWQNQISINTQNNWSCSCVACTHSPQSHR